MKKMMLLTNKLRLEPFNFKKTFWGSFSLISLSLLAACASQNQRLNQPINFCEYVDPSSKLYNPNQLTLEQLSVCRAQAEKILSIQTMQLQIHQQRAQSLNNLNVTTPNGKEINTALNQISKQEPVAVSNNASSSNRNVSNSNSRTQQNTSTRTALTNSQQPSRQILVQKTHPNLGETSIQQHYIAQRSNRATQQQLDQEQAQRIAGEVTALLGDPSAQQKLSAPRLLSPGEETRNPQSTTQLTNSNTSVTNPVSINSTDTANRLTTDNSSASQSKTVSKKPSMTAEELNAKIIASTTNTIPKTGPTTASSTTATPTSDSSKTVSLTTNTPISDASKTVSSTTSTLTSDASKTVSSAINTSTTPSTNYRNSPTNAASATAVENKTNPVAEVVKPQINQLSQPETQTTNSTLTGNSSVNSSVENKSIDSYQAQPLPSLNDGISTKQDPLLLLQQRRAENGNTPK